MSIQLFIAAVLPESPLQRRDPDLQLRRGEPAISARLAHRREDVFALDLFEWSDRPVAYRKRVTVTNGGWEIINVDRGALGEYARMFDRVL